MFPTACTNKIPKIQYVFFIVFQYYIMSIVGICVKIKYVFNVTLIELIL